MIISDKFHGDGVYAYFCFFFIFFTNSLNIYAALDELRFAKYFFFFFNYYFQFYATIITVRRMYTLV